MKICAISPHCDYSEKYDDYCLDKSVKNELISFISDLGHDLIVLPGYLIGYPSVEEILKVIRPGVIVFVEIGSIKYRKMRSIPKLICKDYEIEMPGQKFYINPSKNDTVILEEIWCQRTAVIDNKNVSFAICGEVDSFSKNGMGKFNLNVDCDVLINPTHTVRGRWNHIGEKFSNLSKRFGVFVHVANNTCRYLDITTGLRIYVNGDIVERHYFGNLAWSECEV